MLSRTVAAVALIALASGCASGATPKASTGTVARLPDPAPSTSTTSAMAETTTGITTTLAPSTSVPLPSSVQLEVRSRESWGAAPPDSELRAHEIGSIILHHTVTSLPDSTVDERMRMWQEYHQALGFGDLAYHFVVGSDGRIYEGRDLRYAGATRTAYDPTGHLLVALDGMFDELWDSPDDDDDLPDGADELTDAQLHALIDLLAWASVEYGVDPSDITGHRDHAATACPGSIVYDLIQSGEIARRVEERIANVDIELAYVDR